MINDGLPLDLSDAPDVWGHPLHGKIQSGVLHLPNGATVPGYPEPAAGTGYGDTYYVKRPGWAGPVRSDAQASADAAAGYDWRNHATLTGLQFQLYGRNIGGWLWFDTEGNAWRYRVVSALGPASATVFTIARRRFGLMGGEGVEAEQVLPPVDLQQTGAYSWWAPSLQPMPEGIPPGSQHRIQSTSPDGSNAIYTISAPYARPDYPSSWPYRAIAICRITISASGLAAVSLLYGRADCLGAQSVAGADPWPTAGGGYGGYQNTESYRIVVRARRVFPHVPWDVEVADRLSLNPDWIYQARYSRKYLAAPSPGAWALDATCVLGCWYDKEGTLHTIRARAALEFSRSASNSVAVNDVTDIATMAFEASSTEVATLTISDNGTDVHTSTITILLAHSASRWFTELTSGDEGATTESRSAQVLYNGEPIGAWSASLAIDGTDGPYSLSSAHCVSWLGGALWFFALEHAGPSWTMLPLGMARNLFPGCPAGLLDVAWWSNHCVGVRYAESGPGSEFYNDGIVKSATGPALTPTGLVNTDKTVEAPIVDVLCRGSWCPSTGQFAGEHGNFTSGWTWV